MAVKQLRKASYVVGIRSSAVSFGPSSTPNTQTQHTCAHRFYYHFPLKPSSPPLVIPNLSSSWKRPELVMFSSTPSSHHVILGHHLCIVSLHSTRSNHLSRPLLIPTLTGFEPINSPSSASSSFPSLKVNPLVRLMTLVSVPSQLYTVPQFHQPRLTTVSWTIHTRCTHFHQPRLTTVSWTIHTRCTHFAFQPVQPRATSPASAAIHCITKLQSATTHAFIAITYHATHLSDKVS